MYAQASRTQKIRRPLEMEAIESIEDPTLRFFLEGEAMEKATKRAEAERVARESGRGFAGRFGNDNGETMIVPDTRHDTREDWRPSPPRGHGAAVAFAGLSSLAAIGVAAWMWMTPPVRPALWWVTALSPRATVTETKGEPTPPNMADSPVEAQAPIPIKTGEIATKTGDVKDVPVAVAPTPPIAAEPATPPTSAGVGVAAKAPAAPIVEPIPSPAAAAGSTTSAPAASEDEEPAAESRAGRGGALRGYAWSPSAQAMVATTATGTTEQETAAVNPAGRETARTSEPVSASMPARANAPVSASTPARANAPVSASTSTRPSAPVSAGATAPNPDSVMAPTSLTGPGIAAPSTGPAPDETARVPTTEPAPFEPAAATKSPAKPSAPIVD
jgi:hypothetical protein